MTVDEVRHLRVLIANEKRERLELLAQVVAGLGHEVIAREIYVKEVGAVTARERPDVALVGLGLHSEHALELITEVVREASCPVIALLSAKDPAYVHEAAKRGVCAYIVDGSAEELQSAIDITLQRFAEYHSLQGAFGRRATIEQAKGILMASHAVDADRAFGMLRDHSQHNGHKLVDIAAQAVVDSHLLLLPPVPQLCAPPATSSGTRPRRRAASRYACQTQRVKRPKPTRSGPWASTSATIASASGCACGAAASITRTSWPAASSEAATYCRPSSGAPSCSGDGGLTSRTRVSLASSASFVAPRRRVKPIASFSGSAGEPTAE
jgi:AmiR/NasT family two-component response regulator